MTQAKPPSSGTSGTNFKTPARSSNLDILKSRLDAVQKMGQTRGEEPVGPDTSRWEIKDFLTFRINILYRMLDRQLKKGACGTSRFIDRRMEGPRPARHKFAHHRPRYCRDHLHGQVSRSAAPQRAWFSRDMRFVVRMSMTNVARFSRLRRKGKKNTRLLCV